MAGSRSRAATGPHQRSAMGLAAAGIVLAAAGSLTSVAAAASCKPGGTAAYDIYRANMSVAAASTWCQNNPRMLNTNRGLVF